MTPSITAVGQVIICDHWSHSVCSRIVFHSYFRRRLTKSQQTEGLDSSVCLVSFSFGILWAATKIPPGRGDNSGTSEYVYRPTAACQPARCELPILPGKQAQYITLAISLYQKGVLRESARLKPVIVFHLLPHGMSQTYPQISPVAGCNLTAMRASYEIMMTSSELVGFLIDVILNFKRARIIDFPRIFLMQTAI